MMKSRPIRLLRIVLVIYVLVCVLVGMLQRWLIYMPFHEPEAVMIAKAARLGFEPWREGSGAIIGWKRPASPDGPAANRLVVFHGNTGYALHRVHFIAGFEGLDQRRIWEVYLFEYPGFGARPGDLGEQPFIQAGLNALNTLTRTDSRPIYLLGESLGSGLACGLAGLAPEHIAGLFLLTPFARMSDVASHHYGFLPVRLLLSDRWDNVTALQDYSGPLAMLIASEDEVVTAAQGRLLFDGFAGRKRLWIQNAYHNTIAFDPSASWWREVSDFLLTPAAEK